MAILFITAGITVLAGSINEHEQRILDTVSTPVTYKGKEYIAKEQYVARLAAYMNQDNVDLTKEQADTAIKKIIDNIELGIKEGYMEEVKLDSGEKEEASKEDGKDKGKNTVGENNDGANANSGSIGNENKIEQTPNSKNENNDSSKEESDQIENKEETSTEIVSTETSTIDEAQNNEREHFSQEEVEKSSDENIRLQNEQESVINLPENYSVVEETDIQAELEVIGSSMEEVKDYSDAEPYQKGISLGMFAIIIVIVVALTMLCIILAHKSRTYKRK